MELPTYRRSPSRGDTTLGFWICHTIRWKLSRSKQIDSDLRVLDLSYNYISILDAVCINRLNDLIYPHEIVSSVGKTEIKLRGNPIICACGGLHFLNWLTQLTESLSCMLKLYFETEINIFVVRQSEYYCKRNIVIAVFSIFSVVVFYASCNDLFVRYSSENFDA